MDGRDLDAVVVELSGVADPVAVRQNWDMARAVRTVAKGCIVYCILYILNIVRTATYVLF